MNPIDFQTVDVRLLYWPLSGQAVMAVDLQLQWKAILGALSEQHSESYSWGFILPPPLLSRVPCPAMRLVCI